MSRSILSEFPIEKKVFASQKKVFKYFQSSLFKKLNEFEKLKKISEKLCELIEKEKDPTFLFFPVLDSISKVQVKKIYPDYNFSTFELWLNQYSNFDFEKNYYIRGKIAGKYIPREEYQKFFPVGMGKIYDGSHFVTAHKSPDLDSTIASFWGWLDSFAARVGKNLHLWNVPGGFPTSLIEVNLLFRDIFSEAIFELPKTRGSLTLSSKDIMTQEGMIIKKTKDHTAQIEKGQRLKTVVIVDDHGNYLGDWRSYDVEGVRQIIMLLNNCLRWFENNLHINLISLFAKKNLTIRDIPKFVKHIFGYKIKDCEPAKGYDEKQKRFLNDYLAKVFILKKGLNATFEDFVQALYNQNLIELHDFHKIFSVFKKSSLFDKKGNLIENRTKIFFYLEKIIKGLNKALQSLRAYIERIDIALKIKKDIFGYLPHYISPKADIEEIKMKLGLRSHLTVNLTSIKNHIPMGIVRSLDLRQRFLGTVSLRDFCNFEEIKVAPYLQVISIVDHHKTTLSTYTPSVTIVSDAQATNTLVAEIAMSINDGYSLCQMTKQSIIIQLRQKRSSPKEYSRLLLKKQIIDKNEIYFVNPQREFIEYMHYLFGILDDTDLLMKVTKRDVRCVANILNRMKTLATKKETQIINLDKISNDENFAKDAAQAILKNKDMYSLYRKVYKFRESEVNKNILLCAKNQSSNIFLDFKEQNGCARIGQTKMFVKNIKAYKKYSKIIQKRWIANAQNISRDRPEYDFHLHMISTIRGADEVYKGLEGKYTHKDELWIWIAKSEIAIEHLKSFLTSFSNSPEIINNDLSVEFLGDNADMFEQVFEESFLEIPNIRKNKKLNMAVLYYNAGSLNSRKAMIPPYLPGVEQ